MSQKTVLVIDDSSTIRRLVDTELSSDGYRVLLAPTAEEGIATAKDESPDLIILDHQLPGTTGYEVCCQLNDDPELQHIPVVCSSTLRKKAYAEYTDLPNVIDMLPKPYTPDLLRTIVANAIETAAMVVHSQTGGTAVPEVIDETQEGDLSGSCKAFSVRQIVDFLNNSEQQGTLELDLGRSRISIFLGQGRIQAITGSGIDESIVSESLPQDLTDLAPMARFTIRGRGSSEIDGLVELLDNKVLDARLLRQLLRHQAACLLHHCVTQQPRTFRFVTGASVPRLFAKLPLEISLAALFVDAATLETAPVPSAESLNEDAFVRAPQKGQSLDRAGLSTRHIRLLGALASPMTASELAAQSGLTAREVWQVFAGLGHADLVARQKRTNLKLIIALSGNSDHAKSLSAQFKHARDRIGGKVVRDSIAVKLLARRARPDFVLVDGECDASRKAFLELQQSKPEELAGVQWMVLTDSDEGDWPEAFPVTRWPESSDELLQSLDNASLPTTPATA